MSLTEDFTENEARLTAAVQVGDSVVAAAKALLRLPVAGTEPKVDSLAAFLKTIRRLPTFEAVAKTYDNMLGAGDLFTLRDPA